MRWLIQVFITRGKTLNLHITATNLIYLLQRGMTNLIYLMDHILNQIFKIILSFFFKKNETLADNPPIQIYTNKIKNRFMFKTKTAYKLELLSKETMRLLGSTEQDIAKDENGETRPKVETVDVALMHRNVFNNNYQQASKVLFTFVPDKQFGQLITISPHSLTMLKTTNAEFPFIELWFTDQNNRPLEIEDNVNITLIVGIR